MRGKSVWDRIRALRAQAGVKKTPGAKRTKAEALVNNFGATGLKIAALDLQEFSTEDRDMIMETLTSLKSTLDFLFSPETKFLYGAGGCVEVLVSVVSN